MRKTFYISVLLLTFFNAVLAQQRVIEDDTALLRKDEQIYPPVEAVAGDENGSVSTDETAVEQYNTGVDTALYTNGIQLHPDSIESWRSLKEYAYTKYLDSLLKNKKQNEAKPVRRPRGDGVLNSILNSGLVSILFWSIAILFVLFIIYRLFLTQGVFQRSTKFNKDKEAKVEEEVITGKSNFDALISHALHAGKYRQAVRYQYLRTLHLLAEKNVLELAPDKTNYQYVNEIANRGHQQAFAALTLNYEYVWYGEFNIEKDLYQKLENSFNSLNQKI